MAGLATFRSSDQRKASRSASGVGVGNGARRASGCYPVSQCRRQADAVLGPAPAVPDHRPAVVVHEREEVCLVTCDLRPVERIAAPEFVRTRGGEPAERLRRLPVGAGQQLQPLKVPADGA